MVTKWNKLYDPEAYGTAYKVFLLSNATTLTSKNSKFFLSWSCTKLYNSGVYGLVSILPKGFFY
jgi:hypothetical protein